MRPEDRTFKTYVKGLIISLTPLLVFPALAVYVWVANARPQGGALTTNVSPQVAFTGQEAAYYINFTGREEEAQPAPPSQIDMAFLIDVSGSMTPSLDEMAKAARQVTGDLSKANPDTHFSLMQFSTGAETLVNWTSDAAALGAGLERLDRSGGDNDSRAAFRELDGLLAKARPESKKVVVFYTDGVIAACACIPMGWDEMGEAGRRLRGQGVEIYSVGLPRTGSDPNMVLITGAPDHIYDPVDLSDLLANFRLVTERIQPGAGEGGQVSHRVDGRHFAAPLEGTPWGIEPSGTLTLSVGKVTKNPDAYAHPLRPLSSGVWRVGVEPPKLVYINEAGQLQQALAQRRPLMLVVGWFPLLLGLLPAVLWTLYYYRPRPAATPEGDRVLPEIVRPRPPTSLPALPGPVAEASAPVPTLFIGIGGAGRRALSAVRADLKQMSPSDSPQPYRFLWLDVDSKESSRQPRFANWARYPVEELLAPQDVYQLERYVSEQKPAPAHLRWFDFVHYDREVAREVMNLADGSRGDRRLARLALFRWLGEKGEPLATLAAHSSALAGLESPDETRQIIVFASPAGGVGSGWFLDVGRMLRRLGRERQRQTPSEFVPEIIGVWCGDTDTAKAANHEALRLETETAVLAGAYPQQAALCPQGTQLSEVDTESPYNWIFSVSGDDEASAAAQCAGVGAVLVERRPRTELLRRVPPSRAGTPTPVHVRSIHVLTAELCEQIFFNLLRRVLGPDILLDLEPSGAGGLSAGELPADAAHQRLVDWAAELPPATPLQMIVAAAGDPQRTQLMYDSIRVMPSLTPAWLASAATSSLNQKLRGHKEMNGSGWRRQWMPGEAAAVLKLLASRLESTVIPQARALGGEPHELEILEATKGWAERAAVELERWLAGFYSVSQQISREQQELIRERATLTSLKDREYLDLPAGADQIDELTREAFATWLGTADVSSAIRERLFLGLEETAGGVWQIVLRSYLGQPQVFDDADTAAANLKAHLRSLALTVPATHIRRVLSLLDEDHRAALGRGLVDLSLSCEEALLVAPAADGLGSKDAAELEGFLSAVPQPANQGGRTDVKGHDRSAIRRVALLSAAPEREFQPDLPFVSDSEIFAERIRHCAERRYELSTPQFPPELRIALSHPREFRSFVTAYRSDQIVLREDGAGQPQWMFTETAEFLTYGPNPTLAQAAASYVYYARKTAAAGRGAAADLDGGGDFTKLRAWLSRQERQVSDDVLTQLAIDVFEDCVPTS
ncbi:MAG: VWA domain-containing protein [Acidobacteriota bacterium]|nr:VWA domain-containing protein [Acidobacteriota bacterium]